MRKSFLRACACIYIPSLLALPGFAAAITSTWTDGNGSWNVAGNWDNGIPNNSGGNTYTAVLNNGSSVTLNGAVTINNLTIDAVDSLAVGNGLILTVNSGVGAGSISNDGNLTLNAAGSTSDLSLTGGGTVTLDGSGTFTMSNNVSNRVYGANSTSLVIGTQQVVQGAGQFGFGQTTLTNNGTITSNQSAGLVISPNGGGFTNTNLVQATSASTLTLTGVVTNTGGTIQASGIGSIVKLTSVTVTGGTLSSSGGGVLEVSSASTLNGITNQGTIQTDNGVITSLKGTITNSGLLTLNASSAATDFDLLGGGTVTLTGSGTLTMSNNINNRIYGGNTTALLIDTNQLVQGAGQVGFGQTTITNNGTITANASAGMTLSPNGGGFTNNGTIQASGVGSLTLTGGPFTNSGGSILLGAGTTGTVSAVINGGPVTLSAGSTLNLSSGTIHGGTLTNSSTGNITVLAGSTLGGTVNNVLGGQIAVNNGVILSLESTGTFTNDGTLSLNAAGSTSDLMLIGGGAVTLGGSGSLTMSNSISNRIYGGNTTALIIGANAQVQGAGQLGLGQTTLTNNGTITANLSAGLSISPNGGGFTNTALAQATGGSTLTLLGVITNAGGTIQAVGAGSIVKLSSATVIGGTFNTSGGGLIEESSNSTLNGITNQGTIQADNGLVTFLNGTIINSGLVTLNSSGANTDLVIAGGGTVTLTGSGTLTMSNSISNRIYGNSTALIIGTNQLLQGAGQIGVTQTAITNNGTITANQPAGLTIGPGGGFTNNGTLQTAGSGAMTLTGGPFTNTGGSILLGAGTTGTVAALVNGGPVTLSAGSTLNLSSGTIHGGTLTNSSTGNIIVLANSTLGGIVNNVLGGQIALNNGVGLSLESSGTFTDDGNIALNSSGGTTDLILTGGGTLTLGGSGTLTLSNSAANRVYGNTTALLIGSNLTLQGAGQVGVGQTPITNNGTITSNQPAGMILSPGGGGLANANLVQATSGSVLTLVGVIGNATGTIQAVGGGSIVKLNGVTVNTGTLASSGGGLIEVSASSTFNGITNLGSIQLDSGATTSLSGTITNSGQMMLNGPADLIMVGGGTVTLNGIGTLTMSNNASTRIYGNSTALVIGSNQAIQGAGQIGVALTAITNNGTITANQVLPLTINPGIAGFINTNLLQATSGATLALNGSFTDTGAMIQATGAGSIVKLAGATLTGGTFASSGGGIGEVSSNSTLNGIANQATIQVDAGVTASLQGTITDTGTFTNNGIMSVTGGAFNQTDGTITGPGNLTVTGGTATLGEANSYLGGTALSGSGTLLVTNISGSGTGTGNVTLNGGTLGGYGTIAGGTLAGSGPHTIYPSATLSASSRGTLTTGSLSTKSNTTLAFNLFSPGASSLNDAIDVTALNGLTLNGGTLQIAHNSTGAASLGYYRIIQYGGAIGGTGIGSVTMPPIVNNISYILDANHDPGFIDVHRGLLGDANDDGVVNFADFVLLSNHFTGLNAGWGGADFNNDGVTNFADFVILSNSFGATIGSNAVATSAVSGVPEPASLLLLGAGFLGAFGRRRTRPLLARNAADRCYHPSGR